MKVVNQLTLTEGDQIILDYPDRPNVIKRVTGIEWIRKQN